MDGLAITRPALANVTRIDLWAAQKAGARPEPRVTLIASCDEVHVGSMTETDTLLSRLDLPMKTIALAISALALMGGVASAQMMPAPAAGTTESVSKVPVPGNNSGIDSTMPVDAASRVITRGDAPVVTDQTSTSSIPVPGNTSGIDSTVPADAASRVITRTDAVPADTAQGRSSVPVPGNTSGIDSTAPTR